MDQYNSTSASPVRTVDFPGAGQLPEELYQTVAQVADIPEGQGRVFEVNDRLIAVFHDDGQFFAIDDACPHQGAPLSDGIVFDKSVTCTWHGWRFSLEDGRHLDGSRCRVATYPVRVLEGAVQVAVP